MRMSHVTLTYEWVMAHLNMNESCHTVSVHQYLLPLSYLHCIMNVSCHIYEWVMSHLHMNGSCHTYIWRRRVTLIYEWVMSRIECAPISTPVVLFAPHYEWVMSHIWMSHVTLTYEWVTFIPKLLLRCGLFASTRFRLILKKVGALSGL